MGARCALPCLGQLDYGFAVTLTCRIEYIHRILPSFPVELPSHTSTLIVVPGKVLSRWETKRVTNSDPMPPRPHRRCPITLPRNGARGAWLVQKEKRSHDVSKGVTRTLVHLKWTVLVGRRHDLCRKNYVSYGLSLEPRYRTACRLLSTCTGYCLCRSVYSALSET
ncbi:hypothetical protein HDV62DRAFT_350098 [Trichoderma sp. SZMC 28011]